MVLTCTLAQATAVKNLMTAQVCAMWVRNLVDTTKVDSVMLADTKLGHILITFADEASKPTVAQLQAAFTSNAEVAGISPV